MNIEELVARYIAFTEHVLRQMEMVEGSISTDASDAKRIVDYVRNYLKDAKYYKDKGELEVSLTSVAYCEGLLDALKLLGAVKFEWPARIRHKSEK
jgi:hypothetical protein